MAVRYKDGVVLGADGRVSVGSYISNRASNKISILADNVYLLRSGSAPDTQLISDMGELDSQIIQDQTCHWACATAAIVIDLLLPASDLSCPLCLSPCQ